MAKIADTVPERLRPFVLEPASRARPDWRREPDRIDMSRTRSQIHEGKKIALHYRDEHGRDSERTIWPIAIGYHEAVRILAAWCELRRDFRSFRTMHSSLMSSIGIRPEVTRDNMGHANVDVTQNVYNRTWWEERVEAVSMAAATVWREFLAQPVPAQPM